MEGGRRESRRWAGSRRMTWPRVWRSARGVAARAILLCFTLLLSLKIDHRVSFSWWIIFLPLWLFHFAVARHRFSLPAPSFPHDRRWAPCHAIVAMPLLIAFELLLCIYLESIDAETEPVFSLKLVFFPLMAFEITVLVDNFSMCRALMPEDGGISSYGAIWETFPHFWVAISMVFLLSATSLMLLKLCGIILSESYVVFLPDKRGDVGGVGWWDLFINLGIAECFAFLVCTKWSNPNMHQLPQYSEESTPLTTDHNLASDPLLSSMEDHNEDRMCSFQVISGHILKALLILFQILLCMRLEGKPAFARHIPTIALLSPIFLLQGSGVMFAIWRLIEKLFLLLYNGPLTEGYSISSRAYACFAFVHHGTRLLGWWSIDEVSQEERAQKYHAGISGYDTFSVSPPEIVRKMSKKELADEILQLQEALGKQTEIAKCSQQKYEKLQNEKILCRICFEEETCVILIPCRHHILCKQCSEKCKKCPICRVTIEELILPRCV